MGLLRHAPTDRLVTLEPRTLIGRAPGSTIVVAEPRASAEHAVVSWSHDRWQLRDLGSRNGTFVDGRRLGAAERVDLTRNARLGFGTPDSGWTLHDEHPPVPVARRDATGDVIAATAGLLLLPGEADPRAAIFAGDGGSWIAELDGVTQAVVDQQPLRIDDETWTLFLPSWLGPLTGTVDARTDVSLSIGTMALEFRVSADEEYVEVGIRSGDAAVDVPPRACNYVLLTLARARLDDRNRGVDAGEEGWLYAADLADMLDYTFERLNVEIYRARLMMAAAGVVDPSRLVERRATSRQLRLGVEQLVVRRA